MDEGGRRSSLSLNGYVGWSYAGAGWVIAVVDPTNNTSLTASVVTPETLPQLMRPIDGGGLVVGNGLVFTHVGNYGQTTHQVLPALREAIPTHLGRSIVWDHDPYLQRGL